MRPDSLFLSLFLLPFGYSLLLQLYWWQTKEYRFDRFGVHLTTRTGQRSYFNPANAAKLVLVALFLVAPLPATVALTGLYFVLLLKFGQSFVAQNLILPKFTLRISLTLFLVLFGTYLLVGGERWLGLRLIPSLVVADLVSPLLVFISVLTIGGPFYLYKRKIMAQATAKVRSFPHLKIVGITGCVGKTTTKELIAHFLGRKFRVLATPQRVNTDIGIAQFILEKLTPEVKVLVVEMGDYRLGEIKRICQITPPNLAVLTTVENQHLALFGSMENLMAAKLELVKALPPQGMAVISRDNKEFAQKAAALPGKKIWYSTQHYSDVYATSIKQAFSDLSFNLHLGERKFRVKVPLLGRQNVGNVLAAITTAHLLGMSMKQMIKDALLIKPVAGNMEAVKTDQGMVLINDSYNINPSGARGSIDYLTTFRGYRKIILLSPMLELGRETKTSHWQVLTRAAKVADQIFWIGLDYVEIVRNFVIRHPAIKEKFYFFPSWRMALAPLKKALDEKTVVLCEGRNTQKIWEALL